ncbi:MAG: DUF4124 domain-containing protein [Azoarcus sp.]|jgi:hypothetical protein|nr:DUF4124 domain-containing protein [Azoarcus sp.]
MKEIFLVLGMCLSCVATAGSLQRWTDEQGQVHYGDAPPAGVKAEPVGASNVTVISASPASPAVAPEVLEANRQAYRQAREKRRRAELQAQQQAQREEERVAQRRASWREVCRWRYGASSCDDNGYPSRRTSAQRHPEARSEE